VVDENVRKFQGGELAPLVGIKYARCSILCYSFLQNLYTERDV
jgi:hypothetical protein